MAKPQSAAHDAAHNAESHGAMSQVQTWLVRAARLAHDLLFCHRSKGGVMQKLRVGSVTLLAWLLSACSSSTPSSPSLMADMAGGEDASVGIDQAQPADLTVSPDSGSALGHYAWAKRFGDADTTLFNSLAVDASGNVFVAGTFSGTISLGGLPLVSAGGTDLFIAKYDPSGRVVWSQRFGGSGDDYAGSVALTTSGDVVLLAGFENTVSFGGGALVSAGYSDIALAKYSSAGAHLWSRRVGGSSSDDALSVTVDPTGNLLFTGAFAETATFDQTMLTSAGSSDIFVSKWTGDGTHLWSKRFGGADYDRGHSIATDPTIFYDSPHTNTYTQNGNVVKVAVGYVRVSPLEQASEG